MCGTGLKQRASGGAAPRRHDRAGVDCLVAGVAGGLHVERGEQLGRAFLYELSDRRVGDDVEITSLDPLDSPAAYLIGVEPCEGTLGARAAKAVLAVCRRAGQVGLDHPGAEDAHPDELG
jgi:hypothetical protein